MPSNLLRNPDLDEKPEFSIKYCGDGTNVYRVNGMCVMSFSLFCHNIKVNKNTSNAHHVVTVVKGHESYNLYKECFSNVFNSMNMLYEQESITVEDEQNKLIGIFRKQVFS